MCTRFHEIIFSGSPVTARTSNGLTFDLEL
jgi:hypothetical protein